MSHFSHSPLAVSSAHRFLTALFTPYGPDPALYAEFRILPANKNTPNRGNRFVSLDELLHPEKGLRVAESMTRQPFGPEPCDVYVGVLPRNQRKGTANCVDRSGFYWCDIDFKDLPFPDPKDCLEEVLASIPDADLVVHSGNGIHAYWTIKEVIRLEGARREVFCQRLVKWQQKHRSDNVADLPRILRVPGTYNLKRETPVPVRLLRPNLSQRENNATT